MRVVRRAHLNEPAVLCAAGPRRMPKGLSTSSGNPRGWMLRRTAGRCRREGGRGSWEGARSCRRTWARCRPRPASTSAQVESDDSGSRSQDDRHSTLVSARRAGAGCTSGSGEGAEGVGHVVPLQGTASKVRLSQMSRIKRPGGLHDAAGRSPGWPLP